MAEKKTEEKPMKINPILKIDNNFEVDESIKSYETFAFNPITGTQFNNPGSITITIQNSDNWYHSANSWLEIEGQIIKAASGTYTSAELIAFANNGVLFLFDNIKYLLSSTEIESVFNPGHTSNILTLAKNNASFSPGLMQCWALDQNDEAVDTNSGFKQRRAFTSTSDPVGHFRFAIPLKHIFGFCDDYNKSLYGFTHTLVLTRSSSSHNALFRKTDDEFSNVNVADGTVDIKNIRWMMPRSEPSEFFRYELSKQIKNAKLFNVGFRMRQSISTQLPDSSNFTWRLGVRSSPEQPRFIFLAFQTARAENQQKNYATYDKCDIQSAHVLLNADRYPANDFETDWGKNHYDFLYHEFTSFIEKFYKVDKMVTTSMVDPILYKSLFPIIFFDVSRQSERLKSGVTDITLQCRFKNNPPAQTTAHVVMISDRKLRFKSDGEKMSVLY